MLTAMKWLKMFRKALLICSAIAGLVSGGIYTLLENEYVSYPRSPNPALGLVVPHTAKGVAVFISERQSQLIYWVVTILLLSAALIFMHLVLNQKWPLRWRK
jgi:hypothetical protein